MAEGRVIWHEQYKIHANEKSDEDRHWRQRLMRGPLCFDHFVAILYLA